MPRKCFREGRGRSIWLILIGLLLLTGGLFFRKQLNIQQEMTSELPQMLSYIRSLPLATPIVLFMLAVFQGALPIIPFFLLAGTSGALYGIWLGMLLIWLGAVLGALILFALSRYFGKSYIQQWFSKWDWDLDYSEEQSFLAVFVGRLVPVVPSIVVNVASGVSKVSFTSFSTATALGKLPWTLLYASLGYNLTRGKTWAIYLAVILVTIFVTIAAYRWWTHTAKA